MEACLRENDLTEAEKYVARIPDAHERMELYAAMGAYKPAAEIAVKLKDAEALEDMRRSCRDPVMQARLGKLLQALR